MTKKTAKESTAKTILTKRSWFSLMVHKISAFLFKSKEFSSPLEKFHNNPIIEPDQRHEWESQYVFNPAAIYIEDKVHLIYRAIGDNGVSVLGYASSMDGLHIDERLTAPVYVPRASFCDPETDILPYISDSGGSWGGCEDPRITKLDDTIYMTYTAFDCYPRVALTSINTKDFLERKWRWKSPVLLSPPGEIHKNWVIFPEKIHGQYAILHSITPDISIDYFDTLDFDGNTFIKSSHFYKSRKNCWDTRMRGVGPPPIRTKDGWLVIYHAIDQRDSAKYKIGAMMLDYKNPKKVLYRSQGPILEPCEQYENEGFKSGIIYSCGAVVKDGTLFIYYGGADTVTCVATANMHQFLAELKKGQPSKMAKIVKLVGSVKLLGLKSKKGAL